MTGRPLQIMGNAWTGKIERVLIEAGEDGRIRRIVPADRVSDHSNIIVLPDTAFMVPGLHDAHAHLLWGGLELRRCNFAGVKTLEEFSSVLSDYIRDWRGEQNAWIQGSGIDETLYKITRNEIDKVCSDRPVFIWSHDLHTAFVNGAALVRARIDGSVKDPPTGHFERNAAGVLTGVLRENAAHAVERMIPPPSSERARDALLLAQEYAHSLGLTAISCSVRHEEIPEYLAFAASPECKIRMNIWRVSENFRIEDDAFEMQSRTGLRYATLKGFADGALGSRSAAFWESYSDGNGAGEPLVREGPLARYIRAAHQNGYQIAIHAIGDRANSICLDAIEMATSGGRGPEYRPRIEHVQVLTERDLGRFAEMGVIASMQPIHCTADMRFVEPRIGSDRAKRSYAWRSLLDRGALLAFGSDWPVESLDPIAGIHAAVTRQDAQDQPPGGWQPQERIGVEDALKAYTRGAAYAAFWENDIGEIAEGKLADLTVLSRNIFECDPKEIRRSRVLMTVVGAEIVYRTFD
jgi:predicted amidohydrolase YtcJ